MHKNSENRYFNRELSWLEFNARVLQEAEDRNVPLIMRLRFLGIFSNNLDEFFMVRYASIKRSVEDKKNMTHAENTIELLEEITQRVIDLQRESLSILGRIEQNLKEEGIIVIDENNILENQKEFLRNYFIEKVSPALATIILDELEEFPHIKDSSAYLAIRMQLKKSTVHRTKTNNLVRYALIEIPRTVDRFVALPKHNDKQYIILLDDLIRYCLGSIFNIFDYTSISAHMIKITRDAELDIENDLTKSFAETLSKSVKGRVTSHPVRFVYDKEIHKDTLGFLLRKMYIEQTDSIIPGGRYHYRRDYIAFPSLGREDLLYKNYPALPVADLPLDGNILEKIKERDYLQYTPYHSFSYIIKFLREAALDPRVTSIKITAYRLANFSHIVGSLVNAVKNGKEVTVLIELQARFDEAANIEYAELLETEGVTVIFGVPGLKVHSKICVIERREGTKLKKYGFVSTGNFNESTAKIYTDYTLFTSHKGILKDLKKVFLFFEANYKVSKYQHLIVSPHYTEKAFAKLIHKEIENAQQGKPAYIRAKLNNFSNYKMVDRLYEASRAGVKIQLIVRGLCCLVPGVRGMSENIEVISVVDKFLEHTRLYMFCNDNNPKIYISSADWMTRNIDYRVEVTCPVYDPGVRQELIDTFDISWNDNVKARVISQNNDNIYRRKSSPRFRSQFETYNYYLKKLGLGDPISDEK